MACKVCNNKKRSDWPSNDPLKNITADGKKGYVDPATDEFDDHLERLSDGNIVGKMAILAEGDAAKREDIITLAPLPLFNADGSTK